MPSARPPKNNREGQTTICCHDDSFASVDADDGRHSDGRTGGVSKPIGGPRRDLLLSRPIDKGMVSNLRETIDTRCFFQRLPPQDFPHSSGDSGEPAKEGLLWAAESRRHWREDIPVPPLRLSSERRFRGRRTQARALVRGTPCGCPLSPLTDRSEKGDHLVGARTETDHPWSAKRVDWALVAHDYFCLVGRSERLFAGNHPVQKLVEQGRPSWQL